MNQNKFFFVLLLSLTIIYFFLINVLGFTLNDLLNKGNYSNLLNKFNINEPFRLDNNKSIKVQYPPLKPDMPDDLEHPEFINMKIMDNNKTTRLMAANDDIEIEAAADFTNQQTDISEFIKTNKHLLMDNNRHNTKVADVNNWNMQSEQMYNKILNCKKESIVPYTNDIYALY